MQCASCRFENMPGVGACGRCGSPLGLNTLAIDVHPPRASTWSKRLRRWRRPFSAAYYRAREIGERHWFENMEDAQLLGAPFGILLRMLIPGWAHIHLGHRRRGLLFHGLWLALVVFAVVSFYLALSGIALYQRMNVHQLNDRWGGLSLAGMFLGLAFSVHLASCVSLARLDGVENSEFWRSSGRGLILILAGLYLVSGWLLLYVLLQLS
jgi:hypothetical protein